MTIQFEAFFGAHRPARTVVPVGPLSLGALIEVNAVAVERPDAA
jgi:enamine deaminase RidA (YjgF/YER057c/UK114 family)